MRNCNLRETMSDLPHVSAGVALVFNQRSDRGDCSAHYKNCWQLIVTFLQGNFVNNIFIPTENHSIARATIKTSEVRTS